MAEGETAIPLLDQEGWSEAEDASASHSISVQALFKRPNAIHTLQTKGVARLGEFLAPDHLVFPAFRRDPLLTLGAASRDIDYEAEWKRVLLASQPTHGRREGWSQDVAVEAYVVNVRGAARPDKDGLLQPLLKRWQAGRCSHAVFGLPAVQAVISWKWWTYCRKLLLAELAFFLIWLGGFNIWTIAFQDEDLSLRLSELLATPRGKLELAAQILSLLGMLPFVLLEVGTLSAYGIGWLDAWNTLDFLTYANQVTITAMHLGRVGLKSAWLSVLPALQLILLIFRLQYFLQAFRPTRFAFLDTIRSVFSDMRMMFAYMLLVMWGFAASFHVIFRREQTTTESFDTILHSFFYMFEHQSGLELKPMYSSKTPILATSLAILWGFVMGMILLNLLVGIVVNSLEKATEDAENKMLLAQARIIDELEANIPSWLENKRRDKWYPDFVHVLRINPDKLDQVKTDALWTSELSMRRREDGERGGEAAGSEAAAAPAPPGGSSAAEAAAAAVEAEDLRASLAEVRRQLEEQAGLLRDLVAAQQQQARLGRVGLGQVAPVVWSPSRSGSATGNSVGEW